MFYWLNLASFVLCSHLEFYVSGLQHYIRHGITCRKIRWKFATIYIRIVSLKVHTYIHCLQVAIMTDLKEDYEVIPVSRSLLTAEPNPAQERFATTPGSTTPTLFKQWCGFFYVPQEPDKWKCCEKGPTFFCPYWKRLESLTICRCHYKGSTFFSVIWSPWVVVWLGFEPTTFHSANCRSPNWANQAATWLFMTIIIIEARVVAACSYVDAVS